MVQSRTTSDRACDVALPLAVASAGQTTGDEPDLPGEQIRAILDTIPALVWTARPDGSVDFFSRQWLDYTGLSPQQAVDWGWTVVLHPEDRDRVLDHWRSVFDSGQRCEIEARIRRFDGDYQWFLVRASALRDSSGNILKWCGANTEIEERRRAEHMVRASEHELRLLIDKIPGLVYTMTPTGDLEVVNAQVLEYFGRTFEELKDWARIGCVHPDDLPRVTDSLRRTVEFGESHEVEQRLRRSDGTYRWFKPRGLPLRDSGGRILRWYCLLTDIDDLKRAEEGLRSVQSRLSRAAQLATVSELAAAIAHEVNQPLAAVVANGHACRRWLSAGPANVERALRSADRIVRDGNAAAEVIRRVRSLFQRAPFEKSPLEIKGVIDEVCNLMADELRARGVSLTIDLDPVPTRAHADRVQLQQVLTNLVRNGIEAMDALTDRPKLLSISSQLQGAEIVVHVADQGSGIRDAESLFESFYTTKANGLGMGLAICRSIIEAHGGRMWATNNPACGATFSFALHTGGQE